jgi:pimeloyl-ACP methyl ester carboxylesterase
MTTGQILITIAIAAGSLHLLNHVVYILRTKRDPGGDQEKGLVIFVESLRWIGVPWGLASCAAGLRRAGFEGEFRYWRWHETWRGWLVLPVIADRKMLERRSRELADFIAQQRRDHPGRPIHLIGYSCGGYVATRALELLPDGVTVDSAALLAAAQSPWRDLRAAARRITGNFLVASSPLDFFVIGLGTLLSGTADRVHTPSMGMLGPRGSFVKGIENLIHLPWRPAMIRDGQFGGHFSAASEGFVANHVAPKMGLASK